MDSCYSGDRIAEDHIHMDITTCNIEKSQKQNRLETISNRLLWELNMFYWSLSLVKHV